MLSHPPTLPPNRGLDDIHPFLRSTCSLSVTGTDAAHGGRVRRLPTTLRMGRGTSGPIPVSFASTPGISVDSRLRLLRCFASPPLGAGISTRPRIPRQFPARGIQAPRASLLPELRSRTALGVSHGITPRFIPVPRNPVVALRGVSGTLPPRGFPLGQERGARTRACKWRESNPRYQLGRLVCCQLHHTCILPEKRTPLGFLKKVLLCFFLYTDPLFHKSLARLQGSL